MVLMMQPVVENEHATLGYDVTVVPEVVEGQTIYVARNPDLPRVMSQGSTPDEALANLEDVRREYLVDMAAAGVPVAPPKTTPRSIIQKATSQPIEVPTTLTTWRVVIGSMRLVSS